MKKKEIPSDFPYPSRYLNILGSKLHYIEEGEGDPILFLHGIPTSSYLWRNIIPHLSSLGRCIAPDLIGFGKSDKPHINYSIKDHINYIFEFIKQLNLKNITLVLHDWGSIIGFKYAMQHEKNCKGVVFYESYIRPSYEEHFSLPFQEQIYLLAEEEHHSNILAEPLHFIDKILPTATLRSLSDKEMKHYRAPFLEKNSGQPLVAYLKELPREENHTNTLIKDYSDFLQNSDLPKLLLYAMPGFITSISTVMWAKENLPNLEVVEIGEALHYAQETDPLVMGQAISIWLQSIESVK